jgi:hypothetical protein
MNNESLDINFILKDIYKKIGLRKFELESLSQTEYVLNKKYLIKLNDVKNNSTELIYFDKDLNYSVNKFIKQLNNK